MVENLFHLAKSSSVIPRKEIQAVKAVLQGTTSQHHQQHRQHLQKKVVQQEDSLRAESSNRKDDSTSPRKDTLTKKRNLFEVFKKPSNAKEAEKLRSADRSSQVLDKSELEYIATLKVRFL